MQHRSPAHPMVVRMLRQDLPRMQPSALKHEYLASVANVLRNPVAHETDEQGARHVIGFGDMHRTLPLVIIVEPAPDATVRHALVPSTREARSLRLLAALQQHEDHWATERGAKPRDILDQIRYRGRSETNRHGINHYEGRTPFTKADIEQIATGHWYPTSPLPEVLEIDHAGRPDVHHGADGAKLRANVSASATMTSGRRDGSRLRVDLDKSSPHELRLGRVEIEEPVLPTDQDDPEYE